MDEYEVNILRKELRMIRENAILKNIPLRIMINCNSLKQNSDLFWSNTYLHSKLDDLKQMECNDGIGSVLIRLNVSMNERIPGSTYTDIDYDKIYLYQ